MQASTHVARELSEASLLEILDEHPREWTELQKGNLLEDLEGTSDSACLETLLITAHREVAAYP